MRKFIFDLLFPVHCLGCGREGNFICAQCLEKIQEGSPLVSRAALVPINPARQNGLNKIITVADYKHPLVKNAIHHYKYNFVKDLAEPLGLLMTKKLKDSPNIFNKNNSVLIPVPLHKKRLHWRGFNQAKLLAQVISQELNIPVVNNILIRTKNTPPQAKIENTLERNANIQNAFALKFLPSSGFGRNKTIILIDDIATTSATLQECAKALAPLKPKSICALVFAR